MTIDYAAGPGTAHTLDLEEVKRLSVHQQRTSGPIFWTRAEHAIRDAAERLESSRAFARIASAVHAP